MPELSPYAPAISEAVSKPTHLITPGCAHRIAKSWLPGGGGGGVPCDTVSRLAVDVTSPVQPQAANARANARTIRQAFVRNIGSSLLLPLTATSFRWFLRWLRNPERQGRAIHILLQDGFM